MAKAMTRGVTSIESVVLEIRSLNKRHYNALDYRTYTNVSYINRILESCNRLNADQKPGGTLNSPGQF